MYNVLFCTKKCILAVVILLVGANLSSAAAATPTEEMYTAPSVSELRLCEFQLHAERETFACREFHTASGSRLLLYRGGRIPRAIVERRGKEQTVKEDVGTADSRAAITPPPGISAAARHLGTGVCVDERERALPCEAYLHAPARDLTKQIQLVFYDPDGGGPLWIESTFTGRNHNALTAELAYQMGSALRDAECCHAQAEAYLAYAYKSFPMESDYRDAYQAVLAAGEPRASRRSEAANMGPPSPIGQGPRAAEDRF